MPRYPLSNNLEVLAIVTALWKQLHLPERALGSLHVPGNGCILPSSYHVADLAQSTIAASALAAATYQSLATNDLDHIPKVIVDRKHACAEFLSERLYSLDGQSSKVTAPQGSAVGGLFKVKDGWVRVHDGFEVHRKATRGVLGVGEGVSRDEVEQLMRQWGKEELEGAVRDRGGVCGVLRTREEWEVMEARRSIQQEPILIEKIKNGSPWYKEKSSGGKKCLEGIKVVEMTRVIAGPVAGRTPAAHGADVVWVTAPGLEDQPFLDIDFSRGKRTLRLNLDKEEDRSILNELLVDADVFLQSYRPGSLARKGLSADALAQSSKKGIVCANLSAWGHEGPWKDRRGFDSIVQTASGMNMSEAEHAGQGEVARQLPCQALDHASGYLLATGIIAALFRRAVEGGSYMVDVSLAGTMRLLTDLGQYEGSSGFEGKNLKPDDILDEYFEARETAFGLLRAVKHSASVEGMKVGWDIMPEPLGSDDTACS